MCARGPRLRELGAEPLEQPRLDEGGNRRAGAGQEGPLELLESLDRSLELPAEVLLHLAQRAEAELEPGDGALVVFVDEGLHDGVCGSKFFSLIGIESRMNPAENHKRSAISRNTSNLITTQCICSMNADSDHITGLD